MNAFKAMFAVITSICNVILKLLSSAERGANALDELAQAGENKARNFKELVNLNDENEFEKRKAEINADRATNGLATVNVKSSQVRDQEAKAVKDAKVEQAKKDAEAQLDLA